MSETATVKASLTIEMWVTCPNNDCENYINLLEYGDTNKYDHNDCGDLVQQMFPKNGNNEDFTCDEVVCTECKTEFNVKGLKW